MVTASAGSRPGSRAILADRSLHAQANDRTALFRKTLLQEAIAGALALRVTLKITCSCESKKPAC